jgi:ADP-heptose:LPS heptosyltransferase
VPALRALAAAFPDDELLLCAPPAIEPLARLTGAVDRVVDTAELAPLPDAARRPAVLANLHGRGPQSHALALDASPGRLIAFANDAVPESRGMPPWRADEHEVERWCRLLRESGVPADPSALALPADDLPVPRAAHGATLIHPGAASGARRWPAERFAAVARAERAAGRQVVVTGGPDEVELARAVAGPGDVVLAGRTSLAELAGAVAAADRVACGDTGVAHMATAFGTPSVVLFGPTPPSLWGPPADRPWHQALWHGRRGDPHAAAPGAGLLAITVDEVITAVGEVSSPPKTAPSATVA